MLKRDSIVFESVRLLAVISVALCLIPAGAHFFELANKMSLSTAEYMTTQKIYAGWSFFGVAIIAAIAFTLTHTLMVRAEHAAFLLSLTALLCLGATQVIFWTFTYPINVVTNNWTISPQDFETARRQWEYSHAVNAVLTFVALVTITLSTLTYKGLPSNNLLYEMAASNLQIAQDSIVPAMIDTTDTANVISRPPIAWAVAV